MILIAMDSWKGSLSALEAGHAVARGLLRACPGAEVQICGLADGGEGTLEVIEQARPGQRITHVVTGPLPDRKVTDDYLYWEDSHEAVIEMAKCAGLPLLAPEERNPLLTTTRGVGEWILHAKQQGCPRITLALGGSATVDGGTGMAKALGWQFLDAEGQALPDGGGALVNLAKVIPPDQGLDIDVRAMCDVTNPLLGEKGAARIFGPQKGASPDQVEILEEGLTRLADCLKQDVGIDVTGLAGGGAAGGLGIACVAFLKGSLVSGIDEMLRISGIGERIQHAGHVVTGEGRVDGQSLDGKVLSGILQHAQPHGVPVSVIAGSCILSEEQLLASGLTHALSANDQGLPLEEAMRQADALAERAGYILGGFLGKM